ncbi:MAG: hypothetical protein ACREGJ_04965 [Candidatus Saccharimonadales bacterium]
MATRLITVRNFLVAALFAATVGVMSTPVAEATNNGRGNNGTLKVHEKGTPSSTPSNDPKVCVFNLEGFGFDAGQTGYLKFETQGGSKPVGEAAGPFTFGPTNGQGFYASQYFNDAGQPTIKNGMYKVTLYGKKLPNGTLQDVKAKSKVFKVNCDAKKPAPTEPSGGQILGDAARTEVPGVLPATGSGSLSALLALAVGATTYFGVKAVQKRRLASEE